MENRLELSATFHHSLSLPAKPSMNLHIQKRKSKHIIKKSKHLIAAKVRPSHVY